MLGKIREAGGMGLGVLVGEGVRLVGDRDSYRARGFRW